MLLRMAGARGRHGPDTPYQVVARRFRPQTFQQLVGQDQVLQSLRMALQQKKVPHAFLFSGSRGVGKTTSARILARCLNCQQGPTPDPCGECPACTSILDGSNPDVIEIDAASNNSVDDVRQLREHVGFATMTSRYRVVILDEAHMLSKPAFNALLKTLEEPPPQVVFVLATTELHKVPETIVSRCQVLLFRRVGEQDLVRRLRSIAEQDGVAVPDDVLEEIANSVRGGVRDAETALERVLPLARELGAKFDLRAYRAVVARAGLDATIGVVEALLGGDVRAGLQFAREQQQRGTDEYEALGELVEVLRWALLLKADGKDSGLVPVTGAQRDRLAAIAQKIALHQLDAMISAGLKGRARLRDSDDRGAVFEVALVRMAQAGSLPTLADLLAEVRAGGLAAPAAAPGPAAAPAPRPSPVAGRPAGPAAAPLAAAPPPAPAPPLPPAAGDFRARLLAALAERGLLRATLELCRIDGPANGAVVITPETDRRMHLDRLASPEVQREIVRFVQQVAGAPVQVEVRLPSPGPAAAPPAATVEPGPVTRRVVDAFRGRIVVVDPQDRAVAEPPPARRDDEGAPVDEQPPDPAE
ncbi:MAG: DNA polymerase III subunit gamma/tau [Planctomycetes bacterium]|nr:DNA polymerase III subunit gamma/tau [Planctomycetota bacterium]